MGAPQRAHGRTLIPNSFRDQDVCQKRPLASPCVSGGGNAPSRLAVLIQRGSTKAADRVDVLKPRWVSRPARSSQFQLRCPLSGIYAVGDGETSTAQGGVSAENTFHARNDAANAVGQRSGADQHSADLHRISRFPFRVSEFLARVAALEGAA